VHDSHLKSMCLLNDKAHPLPVWRFGDFGAISAKSVPVR